jgi:hypothetical protein
MLKYSKWWLSKDQSQRELTLPFDGARKMMGVLSVTLSPFGATKETVVWNMACSA